MDKATIKYWMEFLHGRDGDNPEYLRGMVDLSVELLSEGEDDRAALYEELTEAGRGESSGTE